MITCELPDIMLLRQLLSSDEATGKLTWLPRNPSLFKTPSAAPSWNTRYAGREAFTSVNVDGYRVGRLFERHYRAHILVFAIYTGAWPEGELDHRNGNRSDNRPANLRPSDRTRNMRNRALDRRNITGVSGVYRTRSGRWGARIGSGSGGTRHIGTFDTFEGAREARLTAERDLDYDPMHGKR